MDQRTNQLLPASFRGVEFRIRNEVLPEEGRRIVLHEYINSNQRFVEDLGRIPPKFRVQAFVHGPDFKERSNALRRALNEEGKGRLILPVFGAVDAYALPYSVDHSQTEVGEVKFSLEFAVGRPAAGPSKSRRDLEEVYDLGDQARAVIESSLASKWIIPTNPDNSAVAQYDVLQSIEQSIDGLKSSLPSDILGKVEDTFSRATNSAFSIVRSGSSVASNIIGSNPDAPGIWQNLSIGVGQSIAQSSTEDFNLSTLSRVNTLFDTPLTSAFEAAIELVEFGAGLSLRLSDIRGDISESSTQGNAIPLWPATTAGRIRRNTNRIRVVNSTRLNALLVAYEAAAAQSYKTQDQINSVRSSLEDSHEQIMRDDTSDIDVIQSDTEVRSAVEAVRLASLDVLEQKRQSSFDTQEVDQPAPTSSFVKAYNLYAEQFTETSGLAERAIDLRGLNPELNSTMLKNTITVFRAR